MPIPSDGRLFWTGTNASIPAGWAEDALFADRYLQGDNTGYTAPANSGSTSHVHTADAHDHTGNSHTHFFFSDTQAPGSNVIAVPGSATPDFSTKRSHSHSLKSSSGATVTYQSATVTIDSDAGEPEFIKVIVLKPDDGNQLVPDDGIVYTDESTTPSGFDLADGTLGTTDIVDKFLKGTSSGGDGGGTGGATTHTHTSPVHTHTVDNHLHTAMQATGAQTQNALKTFPLMDCADHTHHDVALDDKALSDLSSDAVTVDSASSEPAFVKLLGIQNTSGSPTLPSGVIVPFVGAFGDIPTDWAAVTETYDKQIKATATVGEIGDTGGSDTHAHTTTSHGHTHGVHGHAYVETDNMGSTFYNGGATAVLGAGDTHNHTWTVFGQTPTLQTTAVTMSTDDGRYQRRTVLFIKFTAAAGRIVSVDGGIVRATGRLVIAG